MKIKTLLVSIGVLVFAAGCSGNRTSEALTNPSITTGYAGSIVRVVLEDGRYRLQRNGEDYDVRGAGFGNADIAVLAGHGANSVRNWSTSNAGQLLDSAQANGMTVMLCISIGKERHGFDYDDADKVAAQLDYARAEVEKYKDHPALLAWMIGNEPNLFYENPKVFDAINEISEMIHDVDGRHPTTTAMAGFDADLATQLASRAPDLDFVSIQFYGGIFALQEILDELQFELPFMVTEWGTIGHWEMPTTDWGAPIELASSAKADTYLRAYETAIATNPDQVLGNYVFFWGQKQERTPTWYGMFLPDGSETETIDVMHYIWTGSWPQNRTPRVESLLLDSRSAMQSVTLAAGQEYTASINAADPDGDPLEFVWVIMRESSATESGGDAEQIPETIEGRIEELAAGEARVTAPAEAGPYRLFVYVYDGHGHAGHANLPFRVE